MKEEYSTEKAQLLEKLGATDVKRRLSSFREQIATQDNQLAECMEEMSKIEETMRAESERYRQKVLKEEENSARLTTLNQNLKLDLDKARSTIQHLRSGNNASVALKEAQREVDQIRTELKETQDTLQGTRKKLEIALKSNTTTAKLKDGGDVSVGSSVAGEDESDTETNNPRLPSARKMSRENAKVRKHSSYALADTLLKFGKRGKEKSKIEICMVCICK
eukprot:UN32167